MLRYHRVGNYWEIWNHFNQAWEMMPRSEILGLIERGLPMEHVE